MLRRRDEIVGLLLPAAAGKRTCAPHAFLPRFRGLRCRPGPCGPVRRKIPVRSAGISCLPQDSRYTPVSGLEGGNRLRTCGTNRFAVLLPFPTSSIRLLRRRRVVRSPGKASGGFFRFPRPLLHRGVCENRFSGPVPEGSGGAPPVAGLHGYGCLPISFVPSGSFIRSWCCGDAFPEIRPSLPVCLPGFLCRRSRQPFLLQPVGLARAANQGLEHRPFCAAPEHWRQGSYRKPLRMRRSC